MAVYNSSGNLTIRIVKAGGLKEFNIFDMRDNRMEYEANVFAAQASLPDETILEYIQRGYDIQQIARSMDSDINLIAMKVIRLFLKGIRSAYKNTKTTFSDIGMKCERPSIWRSFAI